VIVWLATLRWQLVCFFCAFSNFVFFRLLSRWWHGVGRRDGISALFTVSQRRCYGLWFSVTTSPAETAPQMIAGLPVVLKFLKCHRCSEIVLKFYSFDQNDQQRSPRPPLDGFELSNVNWTCLYMFIKVPVCFTSYNNNIYEDRKTCIFCVLSLKNVLKFSKNWVLKCHFLLLGALW